MRRFLLERQTDIMNFGLRVLQNLRHTRTASTLSADGKSLTLFVGKLPWTVSKRELELHFTQFGEVSKAEVAFNEQTGLSRGYGFVSYTNPNSFVKALRTEHQMLEGALLEISQLKNTKDLNSYEAEV